MTAPEKVTYKQTDRGIVPVYAEGLVDQPETYSEEDHKTWKLLLLRQNEAIVNRAHPLFIDCLQKMNFSETIPRFKEMEEKLGGWELSPVNGLLSDAQFFSLLAEKKFPTTWWIRPRNQFEYIQEPDLFHDIFGHVPLLMNEEYSSLVQLFGRIGSNPPTDNPEFMIKLARLYWFTVEFGIMTDQSSYPNSHHDVHYFVAGAGLLSSPGEMMHSLEKTTPKKIFSFKTASRTDYKIDS